MLVPALRKDSMPMLRPKTAEMLLSHCHTVSSQHGSAWRPAACMQCCCWSHSCLSSMQGRHCAVALFPLFQVGQEELDYMKHHSPSHTPWQPLLRPDHLTFLTQASLCGVGC